MGKQSKRNTRQARKSERLLLGCMGGEFIIEKMLWMPKFYKTKGAAPAKEVLPRVQRWVEPNTLVFSDGLRAYLGIKKIEGNYDHAYVRHNQGEWVKKEPYKGQKVHTQGIDGMWGNIKDWLRSKHRVSGRMLPLYMAYWEWKNRHREENLFEAMLSSLQQAEKEKDKAEDDTDQQIEVDFEHLRI